MRILTNLRYILFALSIIGLFANFAQNDYSWALILVSYGCVGLIFLIEAFYLSYQNRKDKKLAVTIFTEHFLLFLIGIGFLFKFFHWPGAGMAMVLGCTLLSLFYLFKGIKFLAAKYSTDKAAALLVLLFSFSVTFLCIVYVFNWQHWPGARVLCMLGTLLVLVNLFLFRRKFNPDPIGYKSSFPPVSTKYRILLFVILILLINQLGSHHLSFKYFELELKGGWLLFLFFALSVTINTSKKGNGLGLVLKNTKGKIVMVFIFFGFWISYQMLMILGSAPKLYSNFRPAALTKLIEQEYTLKTKSPEEIDRKITIYEDNYFNFLSNRRAVEAANEGK